jgi:hypothetical protein
MSLLHPQAPTSGAQTLSPASPYFVDPSNIDRRGLIGVGELATPRWNSSGLGHSRTPSLPHNATSPPMPAPADRMQVGSAPRDWGQREAGLGLGVGQMGRVAEESPARDVQRARHQSMSISPPRPAPTSRVSQTQPNTAQDDLEFANLMGSFDDFEFDASMSAALALSLAIPDEKPPSGPLASAVTSPRYRLARQCTISNLRSKGRKGKGEGQSLSKLLRDHPILQPLASPFCRLFNIPT